MLRKSLQGSSSEGLTHSLSGTVYSVAVIRYCAGRSMRTTEKKPSDTTRNLSSSPPIRLPLTDFVTDSGISSTEQQQQQQVCGSTILAFRIIGSTVSNTATGIFVLTRFPERFGRRHGLSSNGSLRNMLTLPSDAKRITRFSTTAIPSSSCGTPLQQTSQKTLRKYVL